MLGWNFTLFILLTNAHKVINKIINNRNINQRSKNFNRIPEDQPLYRNKQHPQLGNRLKRVNTGATLRNRWDPEAAPAEVDWYIETSSTSGNTPGNAAKKLASGMRNHFPRIRSFRNPVKRQKQLDDQQDSAIKQDTWIIEYYQGKFLDEVSKTALKEDPGKINNGGPWTKRHPVKRVTGGMPAVCIPMTKKVYKCRTIKYRGRGITYCWYELEDKEDCASLD